MPTAKKKAPGNQKVSRDAKAERAIQKRLLEPADLTPLELTALAIAGKDAKKLREQLADGLEQAVDFTVRVHGQVHVAGEAMATVTVTPKLDELLPVIFGAVGPETRAKIADWLHGYAHKTNSYEVAPAVADEAKRVLAGLGRKVPQARAGAVTGIVTISRVD